jgi:hypothetical protein
MGLESIVRPFAGQDVSPSRVTQPGVVGVPPVIVTVGLVGGTMNFSFSSSATLTNYMVEEHKEHTSKNFDMQSGKMAS